VIEKMMKKEAAKRSMNHVIDLTKIDGDGAFPCPKCGTVISPDDESEENYQIVDTQVQRDQLEALIVICKKCGTSIKLVGFAQQPQA
jgi:predicted RNA-binding Zn-ribbon protein involved in translation (DUF1610 family)